MDKRALLIKLQEMFPIKQYKKGLTLEDLAVSAGEQNVLRFIENLGKPSKQL